MLGVMKDVTARIRVGFVIQAVTVNNTKHWLAQHVNEGAYFWSDTPKFAVRFEEHEDALLLLMGKPLAYPLPPLDENHRTHLTVERTTWLTESPAT